MRQPCEPRQIDGRWPGWNPALRAQPASRKKKIPTARDHGRSSIGTPSCGGCLATAPVADAAPALARVCRTVDAYRNRFRTALPRVVGGGAESNKATSKGQGTV